MSHRAGRGSRISTECTESHCQGSAFGSRWKSSQQASGRHLGIAAAFGTGFGLQTTGALPTAWGSGTGLGLRGPAWHIDEISSAGRGSRLDLSLSRPPPWSAPLTLEWAIPLLRNDIGNSGRTTSCRAPTMKLERSSACVFHRLLCRPPEHERRPLPLSRPRLHGLLVLANALVSCDNTISQGHAPTA